MLKAIDMHSHLNHGSIYENQENEIYSAHLDVLMNVNEAAGVEKMFCSTFASVLSADAIVEENEYLYNLSQEVDCLYQWVVIDPRIEQTFEQAKRMLNTKKCVGVKLHPGMHGYTLAEYGDKLFSFTSEYNAICLIHSETAQADYILPFADKYADTTFIVAHLAEKHYVDAVAYAKNKNVYVDTSGISSSRNQVIEYAVSRIGSEHILFGTDTYAPGFQRGRIEYALISEEDKKNILRYNSERLFARFLK